eukprot:UN17713
MDLLEKAGKDQGVVNIYKDSRDEAEDMSNWTHEQLESVVNSKQRKGKTNQSQKLYVNISYKH